MVRPPRKLAVPPALFFSPILGPLGCKHMSTRVDKEAGFMSFSPHPQSPGMHQKNKAKTAFPR
jgi:hypothetical protein